MVARMFNCKFYLVLFIFLTLNQCHADITATPERVNTVNTKEPKTTNKNPTLILPSSQDQNAVAENIKKLSQTRSCEACDLHRANLKGYQLGEVNLKNANLEGANFTGSKLGGADFSGANAARATFSQAELQGAKFEKANLRQAYFLGSRLESTKFNEASLVEAQFISILPEDLVNTSFDDANMTGARLEALNFMKASLNGANVDGAFLHDSKMSSLQVNELKNLNKANACGLKIKPLKIENFVELDGLDDLKQAVGLSQYAYNMLTGALQYCRVWPTKKQS